MNFTTDQLIVWLIVGALAGSFAGMVATRRKEGYGMIKNLWVGLVGAVIGGVLFNVFGVDLGLGAVSVSFEDLVAAFAGSLLFVFVLWLLKKRTNGGAKGSSS